MLPPKLPGHSPPQASWPAGATATRPSIGRSGNSMRLLAELGRSRMPTLRARSSCHTKRRAGSGSLSMRVRLSPATALMPLGTTAETAVSRLGRSRTIFTTSVSAVRQALDEERADLTGPRAAGPFVVVARLREGVRLDDVARLDAEDRLAHREGRCRRPSGVKRCTSASAETADAHGRRQGPGW